MKRITRRGLIAGAAATAGAFMADRSFGHHKAWHRPTATPTPTPIPTPTPVPTTLDLSAYPYNYKTGPLGSNNVLPGSPDGALFGIWNGLAGDANLTANGYPTGIVGQRAYLVDHVADIGRTPDIIGAQEEGYTSGGVYTETWIHETFGAVPCITLGRGSAGDMFGGFTPVEILAGSADATINTLADRYATRDFRIMAALGREFELNIPIATSQQQADFRNAWEYMVTQFQSRGADNVGWWWSPGEQADGGGVRANQNACYPGHDLVDWVGTTGYCVDRLDVYNTPLHNAWAEFREIYSYGAMGLGLPSHCEMYGPNKPFVVAETACLYSNTGNTTRKRDWFKNIDDVAKPNMPNLRGVMFFGQGMDVPDCFVDWRAYSNGTAADSYECGGANPAPDCIALACGALGTFDQTSWDGYLYWASRPRWNVGVLGGA
jgi:hypothetical protein